jgi:DNA-binding MarR family transcriptional regulator
VSEPPEGHKPDWDLNESLLALREMIHACEQYRLTTATYLGVTVTESQAISHLLSRGAMGQHELAAVLDMTTGATTALVDRLQVRGFARRTPHPTDRRRTIVELTDKGAATLADLRDWTEHVFAGIAPDERERAAGILRTIAAGLRDRTALAPDRPADGDVPLPRRRR